MFSCVWQHRILIEWDATGGVRQEGNVRRREGEVVAAGKGMVTKETEDRRYFGSLLVNQSSLLLTYLKFVLMILSEIKNLPFTF